MPSPSPAQGSRRRFASRRVLSWLGAACAVIVLAVAGAAGWGYAELRASLAQLDGEATMPGATGTITIERDALGIPTISAATRADVARGLGFVHAQDRFFQMDLARRRAAGELAELFGEPALKLDTETRRLRLRMHARRAIELATPEQRAVLAAYAEGVNAGLSALGARPPEYLLLRLDPRPWAVEDSALVVASMFITLQDSEGRREKGFAAIYEALPRPLADFVTSTASGWETPLVGEARSVPRIPDASVLDLRAAPAPSPRPTTRASEDDALLAWLSPGASEADIGSNSWAVAGRLTKDGGAIVANDMHLRLQVPNTWYRAAMTWQDSRPRRVAGVTLPGVASLVAGSNGDVAWGFTNTTGDWSDLVVVESDPADPDRYRTPSGMQPYETVHETIAVKDGESVPVEFRETIWGPVVGHDAHGHDYALAWVPLREGGMNLTFGRSESAETLEQLFDVAARGGLPAQNMVAAQRDGRIGWTIAGRIPRRVGYDGRLPVSWADGTRGWEGWIAPENVPRIVDPPEGRIVTANNRLVDGAALALLGDGGFDVGARARQIRDDLKAIEKASTRDMLAVQLDDRALFLARWRDLMLETLGSPDVEKNDARRELRQTVNEAWDGRASPDSAAYRIVREFRAHVAVLAFAPLVQRVRQVDPDFSFAALRGAGEGPLWALVSQRPAHLLDPKFATWTELFVAAADLVAADAQKSGGVARYTWGRANAVRVMHPFSVSMPRLARFIDMPTEELPGDSNMPRVQGPNFGASERFAVSPGREQDGYLDMPTGESGHPLSSHYGDENEAWAKGEGRAFIPGKAVHTLRLRPERT